MNSNFCVMDLNFSEILLITRADKGSTTVILNSKDYNDKMDEILSGNNTYITIKKDSTSKLTMEIRTLLTRWRTKDYIYQSTYKKLYISDEDLPRSLMSSLK